MRHRRWKGGGWLPLALLLLTLVSVSLAENHQQLRKNPKAFRLIKAFRAIQGSTSLGEALNATTFSLNTVAAPVSAAASSAEGESNTEALPLKELLIVFGSVVGLALIGLAVAMKYRNRKHPQETGATATPAADGANPTTSNKRPKSLDTSIATAKVDGTEKVSTGRLQGERANRIVAREESKLDSSRVDPMKNTRGEFFTLTEIELATPKGKHQTPR